MTVIYKIVEKDGRDECFLTCGEVPWQQGLYIASILYWQKLGEGEEIELALEVFNSTQGIEHAISQAKVWIEQHLFSEYVEHAFREV